MTTQATDMQVAFDTNHVNVPSMTRQKGYVDYLLTSKAKLLLKYDDLFDTLFSFGISPPDAGHLYEHAEKDDMLTAWRFRHNLLKTANAVNKVQHNDTGSELLKDFDQTILDIFAMLIADFRQIGREFSQKLGDSRHNDGLLKRLKDHKMMMSDFMKQLKYFKSIFKE